MKFNTFLISSGVLPIYWLKWIQFKDFSYLHTFRVASHWRGKNPQFYFSIFQDSFRDWGMKINQLQNLFIYSFFFGGGEVKMFPVTDLQLALKLFRHCTQLY